MPFSGDVEEGNMANNSQQTEAQQTGSAQSGLTGTPEVNNDAAGGSSSAAEKKEKSSTKEKSVLQAKLTKLAIQIGYAGNDDLHTWPAVWSN